MKSETISFTVYRTIRKDCDFCTSPESPCMAITRTQGGDVWLCLKCYCKIGQAILAAAIAKAGDK